MIYGKINGIEKKISKFILGNDYLKKYSQAKKLWDFYFDNGGNTFDNSIYYREGLTENFLGKWIKSRNCEKEIVVISKVGSSNTKPSEILDLLKISLDRLKLSSLDILILHHDNINIPIGEFVDSFNELINKRLIKSFGISNVEIKRFEDSIIWAKKNNKLNFKIINNNLSLAKMFKPLWHDSISSNSEEYLKFLEINQINHFSWSSQARGYFTDENFIKSIFRRKFKKYLRNCFNNSENLERKKRSKELAIKYNCSSNDIALSWVINQKFPSYAIIGPNNIDQLKYSLNSIYVKLTEEEIKWLNLKN